MITELFESGNRLLDSGRYREALYKFLYGIEVDPRRWEFWNQAGIALKHIGRYDLAYAYFDKAIKVAEHNKKGDQCTAKVWYNKGTVCILLKKPYLALECLNKALEIDSNHEVAEKCKREIYQRFIYGTI